MANCKERKTQAFETYELRNPSLNLFLAGMFKKSKKIVNSSSNWVGLLQVLQNHEYNQYEAGYNSTTKALKPNLFALGMQGSIEPKKKNLNSNP